METTRAFGTELKMSDLKPISLCSSMFSNTIGNARYVAIRSSCICGYLQTSTGASALNNFGIPQRDRLADAKRENDLDAGRGFAHPFKLSTLR